MRDKDKRKARRRPLRRSAWVALGPNDLHGCKLFDVSEAGARIEVEDTTPIPDHFMLFLSNNGAARRPCQVVWRNSNQLGVKFEHHLSADDHAVLPKAAADARVRERWVRHR